jgi:tetratricopeptide (TPR) repeat protein
MAQKKTATRSKKTTSKKKPRRDSPEVSERYTKAVDTFERAVKTLHKGDLDKSRGLFETVITNFAEEKELADRAQTFITVCDRKSKTRRSHTPKDFEGMVTHGIFLHNQGDYQGAVTSLEKAVEMEPKNDHALYCLAASYARIGDARGATRHLKRAIGADPYNRVLAISDTDFDSLRSDPTLVQLLAEEAAETAI